MFLADNAPYGTIKCIRSDHGTEQRSNVFHSLLSDKGIRNETSSPSSAHTNGARYVLLLCFLGIIDASRNQKTSRFFVFSFWQENENLNFSSFIRFLVLTERNEFTTQYLVSAGGRVLLLASVLHCPVLFIIKVLPFDNVDKKITVF